MQNTRALLPSRPSFAAQLRPTPAQTSSPRPRFQARVAYTPHRDLNPAHDSPDAPSSSSPQVSQVILDPVVDPQQVVSGWDEPVSSQRLQEEYQRGYEAGLKAALEQQETQPKEKELVHDSVRRTAAKALTWRVLSTATTIGLAIFLLGDSVGADAAMELGVVEFISKYGLYFVHERAWALVTFLI